MRTFRFTPVEVEFAVMSRVLTNHHQQGLWHSFSAFWSRHTDPSDVDTNGGSNLSLLFWATGQHPVTGSLLDESRHTSCMWLQGLCRIAPCSFSAAVMCVAWMSHGWLPPLAPCVLPPSPVEMLWEPHPPSIPKHRQPMSQQKVNQTATSHIIMTLVGFTKKTVLTCFFLWMCNRKKTKHNVCFSTHVIVLSKLGCDNVFPRTLPLKVYLATGLVCVIVKTFCFLFKMFSWLTWMNKNLPRLMWKPFFCKLYCIYFT